MTGTANATISRKHGLYAPSTGSAASGIVKSGEKMQQSNIRSSPPVDQLPFRQPAISNQEGFLIDLHHILSSRTPPPLSEVIDYHSSRPHLRTLRSYNLVLAYAYRLSDFKTARYLLAQMRLERLHDRRSSRASDGERDSEMRESVNAEEEFREVVFQGMWTRGGVGRSPQVGKPRNPMASTSALQDDRSTIGSSFDNSTAPIFPISPPERSFKKGSLMDLVYRSVRPHQLLSEDNETIKRIMLDGKVEQQLGVGRRRRKPSEDSSSSDSVLLVAPGQVVKRIEATQKNSKGASARRQLQPLHSPSKPIQHRLKERLISHQAIPQAVLPVFAVQAMLGTATTMPTAELYLACLKYSLRMSPSNPLRRELREERSDKPKAGSQYMLETRPNARAEIPEFEECIRELLSLQNLSSAPAGGSNETLKSHHFLQLLHLYLHPHLASRFPPLRTIRDFELALPAHFRPLRPTARTLTYALAALRYQRARHIRAMELIQLFRERWGDRSVGLISWKILAKYGSARRCLKTITFARDGLERWHERMRSLSSEFRNRHPAGDTPAAFVPSASRIHWKLPYTAPHRVSRRRIQRKLAAMQQRMVPRRMRRISRQSRKSAVQNLIDRSRLLQ